MGRLGVMGGKTWFSFVRSGWEEGKNGGGYNISHLECPLGVMTCFNKPSSRCPTGILFTDVSSLWPRWLALPRAGWAVVMTDDAGNLISAAFGATRGRPSGWNGGEG